MRELEHPWALEDALYDGGATAGCGVDEAGAGPLMGPVYAAAGILTLVPIGRTCHAAINTFRWQFLQHGESVTTKKQWINVRSEYVFAKQLQISRRHIHFPLIKIISPVTQSISKAVSV